MTQEIKLPKKELAQLFPKGNFRLTDVSLFSIAPPDHAAATATILKKFYTRQQLKSKIYVDGTSNVGGNVLPISPLVKKLIAVEIDELTSTLLQHNLNIHDSGENAVKNYEVLQQDFTGFDFKKHKPDILFVDPPWGGTSYKKLKDKEMYLSDIPMAKLLMDTWAKHPSLIILRVPETYPTRKLIPVGKFGFFKQVNLKTRKGRTIYKLLVISEKPPARRIPGNIIVRPVPYRTFHPTVV